MLDFNFSAVRNYKNRVFGYDAETRAAFLCFAAALLNAVLCALCVFAVAIYLLIHKKGSLFLKKENLISSVFGILVLIISSVYLNYFGILASLYFLAALLIVFSFRLNISKQKIDDIFTMAVAYSVFAFIVAVVQKIFDLSAIEGRSESTFLNALFYCFYISFVILICLYRIIYENRSKLINSALIALNLLAMLVTASKMPIVGIAAAMCVMLLFAKKFKPLIALCVLGALGVCALWLFRDYGIVEKLNMNGFLDSFTMRFPYWEQAIDGFCKKPVFGHGMLGFLKESIDNSIIETGYKFDVFNLTESFDNLKHLGWHLHAHNIAFDCLYNYGIVGSLLLIAAIIKRLQNLYKTSKKNIFDPIMTLVLSSFTFILVDGIVDCQIVGVQTLFISAFLFSVTGIYENNREEKIYEIQ